MCEYVSKSERERELTFIVEPEINRLRRGLDDTLERDVGPEGRADQLIRRMDHRWNCV